jgi:hypothetical protein
MQDRQTDDTTNDDKTHVPQHTITSRKEALACEP